MPVQGTREGMIEMIEWPDLFGSDDEEPMEPEDIAPEDRGWVTHWTGLQYKEEVVLSDGQNLRHSGPALEDLRQVVVEIQEVPFLVPGSCAHHLAYPFMRIKQDVDVFLN